MLSSLFQLCTMYTVLFQLCTTDTILIFFLAALSLQILQGNLMSSSMIVTCLACIAWRLGGTIFVFSLCFFTTDSARNDTLSHCCFPFLPSLSSSPCFLSSPFLLTSFHVSATWIFVLINLWSSGFSPSGQYQCFIHTYLILFSS